MFKRLKNEGFTKIKRRKFIEGLTDYSQSLDLLFNSLYQDFYNQRVDRYLLHPEFTPKGNMRLPDPETLLRWYVKAFRRVDEKYILQSFRRSVRCFCR